MSLAIQNNKVLVVGLLLLVLMIFTAVSSTSVPVYTLWPPFSLPAGEPSILVTAVADLRSGPGDRYLAFAAVHPGEQYPVLGKSPDSRWWRIDFGGQPAWIPMTGTRAQSAARVATVAVGTLGLH